MLVLKEFKDVLFDHLHLIVVELLCNHLESTDGVDQELGCIRTFFNHFRHSLQVCHGDMDHFFGVARLDELEFPTHEHQLE